MDLSGWDWKRKRARTFFRLAGQLYNKYELPEELGFVDLFDASEVDQVDEGRMGKVLGIKDAKKKVFLMVFTYFCTC